MPAAVPVCLIELDCGQGPAGVLAHIAGSRPLAMVTEEGLLRAHRARPASAPSMAEVKGGPIVCRFCAKIDVQRIKAGFILDQRRVQILP
jgi:hypothetical protein